MCSQRLSRVLMVARTVRDIWEERVDDASEPSWCVKRGWGPFLLAIDEPALHHAEAHGLSALLSTVAGAPADLSSLAHEITTATALPRLVGATALAGEALLRVRLRKRAQLSGLLAAVSSADRPA